jgi:transmembrane sensor
MTVVVKQIASLIIKQWRGELSYEEEAELEQWARQSAENRALLNQLTHDETLQKELIDYYEAEAAREAIWKKIDDATQDVVPVVAMQPQPRRRYLYYYLAAAATVAVVLTGVIYFGANNNRKATNTPVAQSTVKDVLPGGNKAVLTLSDGRKIVLDNASTGMLTKEGNTSVNKTKDGELKYSVTPLATNHSPLAYNTLSTPNGGQFQLVLPDGSRVWLNAASSITYPTAFTGNERIVHITGEAFFEVEKDKMKPFKVYFSSPTGGGREGAVEVLGTHFNINAYDDESVIKTTLLEGKVKVVPPSDNYRNPKGVSAILKPGQQASISGKSGEIPEIVAADVEAIIAWKNGDFLFRRADIETIMRQIARWYDVEISYPEGKPKYIITGKIKRNVPLSQVLHMLEFMDVKCELKGKTLKVLN